MFNDKFGKSAMYVFLISILIFISSHLSNFLLKDNLKLDYFDGHDSLVVDKEYYNISGRTESIKNIYLNEKEYFLDENNKFNIKVFLFAGVNIFYLKALKKDNSYIEKKITLIRKDSF